MVQIGLSKGTPRDLTARGLLVGAGLTTSTPRGLPARGPALDGTAKRKRVSSRSTILFRDSAPNPQVFGYDYGNR
jgi:hypothetical protein